MAAYWDHEYVETREEITHHMLSEVFVAKAIGLKELKFTSKRGYEYHAVTPLLNMGIILGRSITVNQFGRYVITLSWN